MKKLTQEQETDLVGQITDIPPDGWWKQGSYEHFMKAALELIEVGYSVDDAVDFLKELYTAVANEYGE